MLCQLACQPHAPDSPNPLADTLRNYSNQIEPFIYQTQPNLIEQLGSIEFDNRTQSNSHKKIGAIEPNRTLIGFGNRTQSNFHTIFLASIVFNCQIQSSPIV